MWEECYCSCHTIQIQIGKPGIISQYLGLIIPELENNKQVPKKQYIDNQ